MRKLVESLLIVLILGVGIVAFFWPQNKVNWKKHRAIIFESDDWGMAAWTPDSAAYKRLLPLGVYAGPEGKDYALSTLENARDLDRLFSLLESFKGADGRHPMFQANYVLATPDYPLIERNGFREFFYTSFWDFPERWKRPGLREKTLEGIDRAVWWPEYHGFSHISIPHWLSLLREGNENALAAFTEQSFVSGEHSVPPEYSPLVPDSTRARYIKEGLLRFEEVFRMMAHSTVAPDLVWDSFAENYLCRNGIRVIQSKWEEPIPAYTLPLRIKKLLKRNIQKWVFRDRFYPKRNVNFEPAGSFEAGSIQGVNQAENLIRNCWDKGEPAVVGTHRYNYVSLDFMFREAGFRQLRVLLARLTKSNDVIFLTDTELHQLTRTGTSILPFGRGDRSLNPDLLLRNYTGHAVKKHVRIMPIAATGQKVRFSLVSPRSGEIVPGRQNVARNGTVSVNLPEGEWIFQLNPDVHRDMR
ncbi:MAG: hypothetical protein QME66_03480 [Candidatus Eisenbacteria bacterium]|nr:hypothetical protein [Candidatus Eisenbacteria bacterium]